MILAGTAQAVSVDRNEQRMSVSAANTEGSSPAGLQTHMCLCQLPSFVPRNSWGPKQSTQDTATGLRPSLSVRAFEGNENVRCLSVGHKGAGSAIGGPSRGMSRRVESGMSPGAKNIEAEI